jgi:hypothetical protein
MRLAVPASLLGAPVRAGAVRIRCIPVPHAKSENARPARRLTIQATVNLCRLVSALEVPVNTPA